MKRTETNFWKWTACGACLMALAGVASASLVEPGASIGSAGETYHPILTDESPYFNIYTGAALASSGWTLAASKDANYSSTDGSLSGIFHSQVWRKGGHLLFAYQVENSGQRGVHTGNLEGYESAISVIDSGVMHVGGDDNYLAYDVLKLDRATNNQVPQLRFYFAVGDEDRYVPSGQSSTWFYAETDVNDYKQSDGTLQNSGRSANFEVLVPLPEPASMALLALGAAGLVLRRRRRSALQGSE